MNSPSIKPVALGCEGPRLSPSEKKLFKEQAPFGLILFSRNCVSPLQIQALVQDFRRIVGWQAPVMIDQEGGRVQRLAGPLAGDLVSTSERNALSLPSVVDSGLKAQNVATTASEFREHKGAQSWKRYPAPADYAEIAEYNLEEGKQLARLGGQAIAAILMDVGITMNLAPVLDVRLPQTSLHIGRRSFGVDPYLCAELGKAFIRGQTEGGVVSVIKHMAGYGRAEKDSHYELSKVSTSLKELDRLDFIPFLENKDAPAGMLSHLHFIHLDSDFPATQSKKTVETLIRGHLGFEGLLVSDCLYMEALSGPIEQRVQKALAAGVDLPIASHGDVEEKHRILSEISTSIDPLMEKWIDIQAQLLVKKSALPTSTQLHEALIRKLEQARNTYNLSQTPF